MLFLSLTEMSAGVDVYEENVGAGMYVSENYRENYVYKWWSGEILCS